MNSLNIKIPQKPICPQIICDTHGNLQGMLNGNCPMCREEEIKLKELKEFYKQIDEIKIAGGIPENGLFWNATFNEYLPENKTLEFNKQAFLDYDFDRNIFCYGSSGTGKTHLSHALMTKGLRTKKIKNIQYIKSSQLNDIKFNDRKRFDKLISCDFLIIDEYGVFDNSYKSLLEYEIIDSRYDRNKYTVINTNLSALDAKKAMGELLYSRIRERCLVLEFIGRNWRLK